MQPDAVPKGLLGKDPNDDLSLGKKYFRAADFGLAVRHFRRAVEPHPRDLTSVQQMRGMTNERLTRSISEGLPQTSMPAWKGVLAPADIDALVTYIARAFRPAGALVGP